ncbi:hypothetical protein like AT1G36940 [Hibiscus trionum]|uniref:Uncharacterized protein n=1 Tax=Hibiscus trionum TaxID=183268 RepID=A0A9W7JJW7_HIBTR|nr:hypothetical protein like AT1G36940 [Hibiscus trionum]
MGNGYHQQTNHKGTFLPLLCSNPSIKDVVLPRWQQVHSHRSASLSEDPLSPKISCMGQVKRNNKIVGFPVSNSCNNSVKYFRLKKLFSGKNLTGSPATTSRRKKDDGKENSASINIETMDPPLPVIKKGPKQGDQRDGSDTLWQRRSRGIALQRLQLQQIHLNRDKGNNI